MMLPASDREPGRLTSHWIMVPLSWGWPQIHRIWEFSLALPPAGVLPACDCSVTKPLPFARYLQHQPYRESFKVCGQECSIWTHRTK